MLIPNEKMLDVELHGLAAELRPIVFQDGKSYCVLYGEDPQNGIMGCGKSVEEAFIDWNNNLEKAFSDDLDIKRILAKREPPEKVKAFITAFRDRARTDETGYDLNKSY